MTGEERNALAYSTAVQCLDMPALQHLTPAGWRRQGDELSLMIADAMETEIAAREARARFRAVCGGRKFPAAVRGSAGLSVIA